MKETRKRRILLLSIGFFVVLALVLLFYFLCPLPKEKIKYTDFGDCNIKEEDKDCKYLFKLENKETILVTLGKEKTYTHGKELDRPYIKLGDKRVWEGATTLSKVVSMRVWGNLIIAHYIGGSGCGILGEVVAYNSDAEQIINYGSYEFQQDVDPNNPALSYYDIKINDEKKEIEIKADHFGGCVATLKVPTTEDNYESIDLPCNKAELEKYNIPNDYVTEARYLIKYQEDGSFSKPTQISKETLEELCKEE
ncbi:MAG TPA: hypothetical protein PLG10_03670 [Candidatus Dojkabacteria bacterium]|jgi:hypothetical protein|nr:hypothetical protein [Candidatus Dojkabacteria bacterium]